MRSVAFLRGINVGGHRVTGDELIEVFDGLGLSSVSTFLASGNVLFNHDRDADPSAIADALEAALGYAVPTTTRSGPELVAIDDHAPFSDDLLSASDGKPQVMLLFESPSKQARAEVLALAGDDDLLDFGVQELHWLPSGGILDSDLDLDGIASILGTNTMRTANTIRRLVAKL